MRARWVAALGAAAAVSALPAATGWLTPAAARRPTGQEPGACLVLQAENEHADAPSVLRLMSLPSGLTMRVTESGYRLNALGYSATQDVVYAIADGTRGGQYEHGAHAVRIARDGTETDLGVVARAGARRPVWSPVTGATAGAIAGNRWYVRRDSDLYTVDVDPASPDYVRVVHRTSLRPVSLASYVDDFAYDPTDGLLYGVSASSRGDNAVVTLDPATGKVAVIPGPRFPAGGAYGSVVLTPDAVYATANRAGYRSVTYRLPRDGSGPAVEVATGPPLDSSDAAGCLGQPSPPPPPPPPPSRSETPPPPTKPVPPKTPPSPQPPPVEQPVPTTSTPTSTPGPATNPAPVPTMAYPPPHPSTTRAAPTRQPQPAVDDATARTARKRRWGLTALILVLGGGAAVAHVRRHR